MQEALFYGFSLERRVPDNHLLRKIDRFVDLTAADGPLLALSAYGSFLAHSDRRRSNSGTRASGRGQSVTERSAIVS
jgi:hypothetical protein